MQPCCVQETLDDSHFQEKHNFEDFVELALCVFFAHPKIRNLILHVAQFVGHHLVIKFEQELFSLTHLSVSYRNSTIDHTVCGVHD